MNTISALTPRQKLISDIVFAYELRYKEKVKEAVESSKVMRGTRANKFGSDKSLELRWALRLPGGLWRMFEELIKDPLMFHEEAELKWFMKTFPQYRLPERW